jgi:epoxyqueuosine reductase QueG
MDTLLTAKAKQAAYDLGSHLVGVGNIERWENCPPLMSPAGIMPEGKSVLVCALHHTDGMIEIGGEYNAHEQGTYSYQMLMNYHLNVISYTMSKWFEDHGWRAVPITASNIWRYREYKDLDATFAPDMSHIYAGVAAGLSELGWSGLSMTPEYGARNRFVSIITDAPLVPTPLLPGNTLCDRCNMCVKHCPTMAFEKEVKGEVALEIEGNTYTRCDKNLWRCAWAEHFGLSIDADIPEEVNEQSILDSVEAFGLRGGTMGSCLKYCLPKEKRGWDKDYSSAPIRKKDVTPTSPKPERRVQMQMVAEMLADGVDRVVVKSREELEEAGIEVGALLPDAKSFILIGTRYPEAAEKSTSDRQASWGFTGMYDVHKRAFFASHMLEKLGYSATPYAMGGLSQDPGKTAIAKIRELSGSLLGADWQGYMGFVLTSAVLEPEEHAATYAELQDTVDPTAAVYALADELGADLVGISSADRMDKIVEEIRPLFEGETILNARDTGKRWLTSSGEVTESKRAVYTPEDHLTGAKSVIVLGYRIPQQSVESMGRGPAEAIGPYAFAQHQSHRHLDDIALRMMKILAGWGIKSTATYDLCGTGSWAANPRGPQPNGFCNRFAAVGAGLGTLTKGGFVNTDEFGPNVRFLAIVVDAELDEDEFADLSGLRAECKGCDRCVQGCTVNAFKKTERINIGGKGLSFNPVEQVRCDWALRYGLIPEEGVVLTGSKSNAPIPEKVTAEALAEGMSKQDTILKIRPCVAEMCMMSCPYTRTQE